MYTDVDTQAERGRGHITLFITKKYEVPPIPYELQGFITPQAWASRMETIRSLCKRFSSPLIERIWFLLAFTATLVIPMVLSRIITNSLLKKHGINDDTAITEANIDEAEGIFAESRAITIGVFLAVAFVFWVPLTTWKLLGSFRARRLTQAWEREDRTTSLRSFIPVWNISTPGVFNVNAKVTITTPPMGHPTVFHPDAYLPPYLQYAHSIEYQEKGPEVIAYGGPIAGGDEKHSYGYV